MTRISKRVVNSAVLSRIYRLFFEVFARSQSHEDFILLLEDIFSPTEKIMIAKRIGIIYLLVKGIEYREIAEVLKVSTSTVVSHAAVFYKRKAKITDLIKNMLFKEKALGFLEDIFVDLFIQPGIKIGHHQLRWEHEKRKEEKKIIGT